jgi:hypothetical protein
VSVVPCTQTHEDKKRHAVAYAPSFAPLCLGFVRLQHDHKEQLQKTRECFGLFHAEKWQSGGSRQPCRHRRQAPGLSLTAGFQIAALGGHQSLQHHHSADRRGRRGENLRRFQIRK